MRVKTSWVAVTMSGLLMGSVYWTSAQQHAAVASPAPQTNGGFVPGQKRAPINPAVVARGKVLFGINCQACHGQDLRGGDLGGPNLLRSQVTLSDQDGELIVPIIQGSRQAMGMPAIGLNLADSKIVAAYVRSVVAMIGRQGRPPGKEKPLDIVTGNASDGSAYFVSTCAKCHAAEGDLKGIASRFPDPKVLQEVWLEGGRRGGNAPASLAKAKVSLPSGENVEGTLVRIDDFLVTVRESDGTTRSFQRSGDTPTVVVSDPLQAHKDLLPIYTDKAIHDVTAYLVTLK